MSLNVLKAKVLLLLFDEPRVKVLYNNEIFRLLTRAVLHHDGIMALRFCD